MELIKYKKTLDSYQIKEYETDWIQIKTSALFDDIQPKVKAKIIVGGPHISTAKLYVKHCVDSASFELIKRFEEPDNFEKCKRWVLAMVNNTPDFVKIGLN